MRRTTHSVARSTSSDNCEPMLRHPVIGYSLSLAVVLFGSLAACGTDNGEDPYRSPAPSSPSSTRDAGGSRPPFDAGTTDPGNPDPGDPDPGDPDPGDPDPGNPDPGNPDPPDPGQCSDPDDPGGTEPLAKALADTSDGQNKDITIKGVLNGLGDVDFYKFNVADSWNHKLETKFSTPTKGVELCAWVSCKDGDIDFKGCKHGGAPDNTLAGMSGCCVSGPGSTGPDWGCGGGPVKNDSAKVVVRLRQSVDECTPYAWSYNF